jgi:hypothetical protein
MHENLAKNAHHPHTGIRWPFYPKRFSPQSRSVQSPVNSVSTDYLSNFICWRCRCFLLMEKQRKTSKKEWAL